MKLHRLVWLLLPFTTALPAPYYLLKPPAPPDATPINLSTWVSLLPLYIPISSLSIPGTHDTMAYLKDGRRLPPTTQTQHNDLSTQLRKGIRYLDLRLQHHKDRFTLHHGKAYLHFDLPEVISIIEEFLKGDGKDETILVRIMCNNCHFAGKGGGDKGENGNTRTFAETMEWYRSGNPSTRNFFSNYVYQGKGIPMLGDSRGKIVVLQDFPSPELMFGINWNDRTMISLQDSWAVSGLKQAMKKINLILAFFYNVVQNMRHSINPKLTTTTTTAITTNTTIAYTTTSNLLPPLAINHLSASGVFWGPRTVSNYVYTKLYKWMMWDWDNGRGKPMGVVVGDYMTEAVARVIIEKNFLKGGAGEGLAEKVDFRWGYWNEGYKQEKEGIKITGA
ncbi:PLC-like phosphodiesterase [Wilcoxina mikolae CBS 423.85]|nr:PLC-like phosphodiesterase [Wilcoxina mikolae CBS 423.85]